MLLMTVRIVEITVQHVWYPCRQLLSFRRFYVVPNHNNWRDLLTFYAQSAHGVVYSVMGTIPFPF